MVTRLTKGRLKVTISETRAELGEVAAREVAAYIRSLLETKPEVNIIFASAPSQNEFLQNLLSYDIDWPRVNAFHMDEYIGIDPCARGVRTVPSRPHFFEKEFQIGELHRPEGRRPGRRVRTLRLAAQADAADIVFLGIGENRHLAFNDPHVAFFDDPLTVKTVDLAPTCIRQQINDGCFKTLEEVPTHAYTITIPELLFVKKLYAIVPTIAKANAIKGTCDGPIVTACPASILRTHRDCTLYVDRDSASLISK